jgi:tRNA (guanine37-N1)-methyltransferase
MDIHIVSLFPERLQAYFSQGVLSRVSAASHFSLICHQLRDHSHLRHAQVDDHPFGGKHGMLLRADVAAAAITAIPGYAQLPILMPCPKGPVLHQRDFMALADGPGMIVVSPAYEGIDDRIYDLFPIRRFSCGDYVLTSGDIPAMLLCDGVLRMVPGVLGNPDCRSADSIASGFLEHPQYTQPRDLLDKESGGKKYYSVPEILCGGHHKAVAQWKWVESLKATLYYRPDLLLVAATDAALRDVLERLLKEPDYEFDIN